MLSGVETIVQACEQPSRIDRRVAELLYPLHMQLPSGLLQLLDHLSFGRLAPKAEKPVPHAARPHSPNHKKKLTAMLRLSLRAVPGCGAVLRRSLCSNAVGEYQAGKGAVGSVTQPEYDKASISQFTGVPLSQLDTRMVKIFKPPQGVQNGTQNTLSWKMQWEDNQTKRWTNPLMGWSSTSDPLSNTHMTMEFQSSDAAVRFCEQNGNLSC